VMAKSSRMFLAYESSGEGLSSPGVLLGSEGFDTLGLELTRFRGQIPTRQRVARATSFRTRLG
jgi:hypothetical protein